MTTVEDSPSWAKGLNGNPLPWLLEEEAPAVRHLALLQLCDRPEDDPDVRLASAQAMQAKPIASILAAQQPPGYWLEPGPGYSPKYRATVWQLIFLDQLGADASDARVQLACEYVLAHTQADSGGFSASIDKSEQAPTATSVIHCLNGNLLRALIGFGFLEDERVQRAISWQARSITGEGMERYYASGTSGPGFACGHNDGLACAWGAIKALLALARIPVERRTSLVDRAIAEGSDFLLSRDPADADYPMGRDNTEPSGLWFKPGFPSGYVADVLQNLEALCELGFGADTRLRRALGWLLHKQDEMGRWRNETAYNGRTWTVFERQGRPSRWVTLRACRVLKMVHEAGGESVLADRVRH